MISACAARALPREESSDEGDTSGSDAELFHVHAGSLDLVRHTLQGVADHDPDEGDTAFGRYAQCIRLGRDLWETPDLSAEYRADIRERFFDDGSFPTAKESLGAAAKALSEATERPQP